MHIFSSCIHLFIQVNDLEFAQVESQVIQGLKVGNESLKKLHRVSVQSKRERHYMVLTMEYSFKIY